MVKRTTTSKRRKTQRTTASKPATHAPTIPAAHAPTMADVKHRLEMTGTRLQVAGFAAQKFAHGSLREVTGAVKASREPMATLWRTVRLAGRHIVREANAAWHDVRPTSSTTTTKKSAGGRVRRPTA